VEYAIQFENVSKTFLSRTFKNTLLRRPVNRVDALKDISLSIGRGQVFGLLGSNGAGKTTLIKLIAGLISPDEGRLKLFGQAVDEDRLDIILSHVGLVTNNERTFYWRLTGRQNLDFFGTLYNLPSQERKKTLNQLLVQMELEDIADRPFMTYSMGQKQRFAIARSLLNNPRILLFDEATTNLDPLSTKRLLRFVKDVLVCEKQHTILWCTHNLAEAEKVCDNIAIIHKGRIISQGTLSELQARCSKTSQFSIIVQNWHTNLAAQLAIPPEVVEAQEHDTAKLIFACPGDMIPTILRELLANQVNVFQCTLNNLQLEDIFEEEIQRENRR
jgi:ABC-2 type transport system ATP-binding protein